jgi:hypothetical protein
VKHTQIFVCVWSSSRSYLFLIEINILASYKMTDVLKTPPGVIANSIKQFFWTSSPESIASMIKGSSVDQNFIIQENSLKPIKQQGGEDTTVTLKDFIIQAGNAIHLKSKFPPDNILYRNPFDATPPIERNGGKYKPWSYLKSVDPTPGSPSLWALDGGFNTHAKQLAMVPNQPVLDAGAIFSRVKTKYWNEGNPDRIVARFIPIGGTDGMVTNTTGEIVGGKFKVVASYGESRTNVEVATYEWVATCNLLYPSITYNEAIVLAFFNSNTKEAQNAKILCCSHKSDLTTTISSDKTDNLICGTTNYFTTSTQCDIVMNQFCVIDGNNKTNQECGCYDGAPYDPDTDNAQIYIMNKQKDSTNARKECGVAECLNKNAYKTRDQQNKCSSFCGIIQNITVADMADMKWTKGRQTVNCGPGNGTVNLEDCGDDPKYMESGQTCNIIPNHGYICENPSITCTNTKLSPDTKDLSCRLLKKCPTDVLNNITGLETSCTEALVDNGKQCVIKAKNNYTCDPKQILCNDGNWSKIPSCLYTPKPTPDEWLSLKLTTIHVGKSLNNEKTVDLPRPNMIVNNVNTDKSDSTIYTVVVVGDKLTVNSNLPWPTQDVKFIAIDPMPPPDGWENKKGFKIVNVGQSLTNTKFIPQDTKVIVSDYQLNPTPKEKFEIKVSDISIEIKRLDVNSGWKSYPSYYVHTAPASCNSKDIMYKPNSVIQNCPQVTEHGGKCCYKGIDGYSCDPDTCAVCNDSVWEDSSNKECVNVKESQQRNIMIGSGIGFIAICTAVGIYIYYKK